MSNFEYDLPKVEPVLIDPTTNSVIDKSNLTPVQIIKLAAQAMGQQVRDPNKDCKKCLGRGYVALKASTKEPIPCECMFIWTKEQKDFSRAYFETNRTYNRTERRRIEKMQRKVRK